MTHELLELARSIALDAGELAARRRREGVEVAATKSTIVDIVTEADREVELLIREQLADARPDDGILGEEGGSTGGTSGLTWVVDPIDGTVNYLYGIPHYAVSIAVVEGEPDPLTWEAVAGCVANPATGEIFTAARGEGAFLGNARHPGRPAGPARRGAHRDRLRLRRRDARRAGRARRATAAPDPRHPAPGHRVARPLLRRRRALQRLLRAHAEPLGPRRGRAHRPRGRRARDRAGRRRSEQRLPARRRAQRGPRARRTSQRTRVIIASNRRSKTSRVGAFVANSLTLVSSPFDAPSSR